MELAVVDTNSENDLFDARCPDTYFTAGFGASASVIDGGQWQALCWRDRIVVPYILRTLSDVDRDIISPYGFSGVYATDDTTLDELARFWELATEHWRREGVVSAFFRFSPLEPASVAAVRELGAVTMIRQSDTITVNVRHTIEQIWANMESCARRSVRKARSLGMYATIRIADIDDVRPGSPFRELYAQTMKRVDCSPEYLFSEAYYQQLVDGMGKRLFIAEVHQPAGAVIASALVLHHRDRAHYHLAGSTLEGNRGANNLLLWTIMEWAAVNGCTDVHLGGTVAGTPADDGLTRFKLSLGGVRIPRWTGTAILNPMRYDALLADRANALGCPVQRVQESGYFPGYRWQTR